MKSLIFFITLVLPSLSQKTSLSSTDSIDEDMDLSNDPSEATKLDSSLNAGSGNHTDSRSLTRRAWPWTPMGRGQTPSQSYRGNQQRNNYQNRQNQWNPAPPNRSNPGPPNRRPQTQPPSAPPNTSRVAQSTPQMVNDILRMTNQLRTGRKLIINQQLNAAAMAHAKYMYSTNEASHRGVGRNASARQRARIAGYTEPVTENVATTPTYVSRDKWGKHRQSIPERDVAARVMRGWGASQGHSKNIRDKDAMHMGFAKYGVFMVQMFGLDNSSGKYL